jgi:hypothetical protein
MPTLTELTLIKKCVETPIHADLTEAGRHPDTQDSESRKKKVLKHYHMFWTAVQKYLNLAIIVQQRAVEFPGLGVIG